MSSANEPSAELSRGFVTTSWTQVLQAKGDSVESRAALSDLCAAYYAPVQTFIRYYSHRDEETVRDLTQEFFARLLARGGLPTVDPERGRFRSFLLGAVKNFICQQHEYDQAAKRGGGQAPLSIEAGVGNDSSTSLQIADPFAQAPDTLFDRQWALTVVERALNTLGHDFASAGKQEQFETLKPWLLGEVESLSQAQAAQALGLSEGAVKVAIHRLRKRFRELVKTEIAGTVGNTGDVQDELRYLLQVLS